MYYKSSVQFFWCTVVNVKAVIYFPDDRSNNAIMEYLFFSLVHTEKAQNAPTLPPQQADHWLLWTQAGDGAPSNEASVLQCVCVCVCVCVCACVRACVRHMLPMGPRAVVIFICLAPVSPLLMTTDDKINQVESRSVNSDTFNTSRRLSSTERRWK